MYSNEAARDNNVEETAAGKTNSNFSENYTASVKKKNLASKGELRSYVPEKEKQKERRNPLL